MTRPARPSALGQANARRYPASRLFGLSLLVQVHQPLLVVERCVFPFCLEADVASVGLHVARPHRILEIGSENLFSQIVDVFVLSTTRADCRDSLHSSQPTPLR
ncbi:protein of unknown function [Candidatus Methylomirabilis oxygeniifera]|uniref:Uncharacterized protein n=1 Tax=Methylomirabilis oxygeniifera TaxID=671143 RepID=D5MFL9_METO1|nr:protein of unknown function [Candidatus Methylomirabilis oxyfera]